ncbi:hypothetical protein HDV06_004114 [Boothiomyces sp. JEL0866]|nr:hypothetical protein HDV06_007095 [Boothiomyces sp. JEL0866]KAJ3321578.1 hypothetical protein HDV06_004114 [Boothiomyces sp. JEL0866]
MFRIWRCVRTFATRAPLTKIKISLSQNSTNVHTIEERQPTKLKKELDSLQSQHPHHILLVQVGMFYEIYDCGNYLDEVSNLLNLRIAHHKSNDSKNDHRYMRFAGFPMISLKSYLPSLLSSGKSVAIVNQIQKDSLSNSISRRVVRIITSGTVLDELDTVSNENNFLLSIYSNHSKTSKKLGLAWLDISTGEFYFAHSNLKELANELVRIQPKEILLSQELAGRHDIIMELQNTNALITKKPQSIFISEESRELLSNAILSTEPAHALLANSHKEVLKGLKPLIVEAASGLISYIAENFPDTNPVVQPPVEIEPKNILKLDPISIKSLEIIKSLGDNTRKGSLLSILDNTKTNAGSRLLASRLTAPSTDLQTINERLNIINIFYENSLLTHSILELLSECSDIEKALQRIHFKNGGPLDLYNIISTLKTTGKISSRLLEIGEPILQSLVDKLGNFDHLAEEMHNILNSDSFKNKVEVGIINDGVDKELDDLRNLSHSLLGKKETLSSYLQNTFGIKAILGSDLKYGPVVSFGNVVESTRSRIESIVKKSAKMNMISSGKLTFKIQNQDWTILSAEIVDIQDRIASRELSVFEIKSKSLEIIKLCGGLAEIDVLCSNAKFALDHGYVKPEIKAGAELVIEGGRHPVVERFQLGRGNTFVINDVSLTSKEKVNIITGPNMGGKSTYLRQCALITLVAQAGLFVPCSSAKLGVVDHIFTRIGSSDDLSNNKSTFMVEMEETAYILKNATKSSLIIMDEVGRGTSTKDGLSLAMAILEYILLETKSLCLFATHYHELGPLTTQKKLQGIAFYQASAIESKEKLTCLYKIQPGLMDQSHGIMMAKMAGLPSAIISNAKSYYKSYIVK